MPKPRDEMAARHTEGGRSSFDALYREAAPSMRQFVKRLVGCRSEAEDIVQDAFCRAWLVMSDGSVDSPRAFLFRIARNLSLNHVRNARVRASESARASIEEGYVRPPALADDQMIAAEQAAACREALEQLPARCRQAFTLRVVNELSYKELSENMRLSISTLEKHVGKGKQLCRSRLTDGWSETRLRKPPASERVADVAIELS
ncbi:MAG: RNA polymerase sigma factor [Caulobacteraceae bacterium]